MIRVRFAPSPTGRLHLGNIRTALFNYLFARAQGGKFILRLEDTDRERFLPEYRSGIIEDMRWMGLNWDEGPENNGPYGPYEQSERLALYQGFVKKLLEEGRAYYCYVTQEETDEAKRIAKLNRLPPRFDNRGRNFSKEEIEARTFAPPKSIPLLRTSFIAVKRSDCSFFDKLFGIRVGRMCARCNISSE